MSEIKIKIGAELDMANLTPQIQSLIKGLEQDAKIKIDADTSQAEGQIKKLVSTVEGIKDVSVKTTIGKDGEIDKAVIKYKEMDGTAKSIHQTMNKKTELFETAKIDSTVKSMEKMNGLTNDEIQSRTKLISFEKQLNNLKEKSYKIKDKGSDEYKKAEADIQRLTATTKQYQGSLESVSKTKLNDLNGQIKEVDKNTDQLWKTQQRMNKEKFDFNKVGGQMESAGRGIMALSAPVLGLGVASVKASTDFENSFAGVRKTVSATEQEFTQLSDGFREMSKTMPQSASSLAEIGEVAGQLGVEVPNIQSFTKTIADMSVTTDMTAQEAGTSMAKFANIMGTSQSDFDRLGSSIVDLGNNLSTSEKPILEMGLGLAGVAKQVGMTEGSTLGLAGALSSVGIGAERGASSVSKALINMQLATETGGESLEQFAKVAGMSGEQFTQAFKDDAGGAFVSFIKGLKSIEEDGGSVIATLDEMGISEIRLRDTLIRATNASDLFSDSMSRGNSAFNENVALSNEANQRYDTTASKLEMMRNRVTDVAISLGGALAPSVIDIADKIANVVEKFSALDVSTQASIVKFGAFGMVAGTSLNVLGKGFRNLDTMSGLLETITGGFGGVSKGVEGASTSVSVFAKMGTLISNPYVIGAVAIVGAIALISKAWSNHKKEVEETAARQDEFFRDYETNSKKNAEGVEYLRENGAEHDRLTEKMGANQDITKLTANELARYNDLVKNMDGFGILNGQLDEHGNMIADTTDGHRDLIKAMEETQAIADRKIVSDFNKQKDSMAKNIDGIKTGGKYGRAQKRIVEIELMLDSNYEMAINRDGEWDFRLDAGSKILLTPERREELQLQLDDHKITVSDVDIELEMENDKIREMLNANLTLATRDLEIPDSAKESFKTVFDDLIEIDPISAMNNGKKLSESFAKTMDTLKKEFDLTGDFSVDPLRAYGEELTSMGIKHDKVSQQIGEMGYTLQGNEGHIQAISSAMEEFSNTGTLSEATITSLSEKFSDLGLSTEMSGAEILTAIGSVDKYASSLIMGEEAFKGFDQAQQEMINSIKNSNEALDENSASKMIEGIKQSTQEALTETEIMKVGMLEAINGMKGLFPDDVLAEFREGVIRDAEETEARINSMELEGFNEAIKKSLKDDGSFGEYTQSIIDEIEKVNGIELENKEGTWTIVGEGFQEVKKDVLALNGIWGKTPEGREYYAKSEGLDRVILETAEAQSLWDGLTVEEKIFLAEARGLEDVMKADAETIAQWLSNHPELKQYFMEEQGSREVIDGVSDAKGAWDSLAPKQVTHTMTEQGSKGVVDGSNAARDAWGKLKGGVKTFTTRYIVEGAPSGSSINPTLKTLSAIGNIRHREKYTGDKSFSPNGYASGTPTSNGMGMAYVAELGQELLVYPNNDIALTGHKPELRNIPRGTQIFNHKDTQALLNGEATLPIEDFDYNNMKSGAMINQAVKSGQSVPSFAKGNTKVKKDTTKEKEYSADYDRYLKYESALERINNQLEILKSKEELIYNDSQIIKSQNDRIKYYKEQQKLVHQTAEAMRKERDDLQSNLGKQGFKFSGKGDSLTISNLELIKGKSKEVEEQFKRFFELQDTEIPKQQKQWFDYAKSIKEAMANVDKYASVNSRESYVKDEIDFLKAKESTLKKDEEILQNKIDQIKQTKRLQNVLHDYANEYRKEREDIRKTLTNEGVKIFGEGDSALIFNFDQFEGKSAKVLELAERFNELGSLRNDKSNDWWSSQNDIVSSIQDQVDKIKSLKEELEGLDYSGKAEELEKQLTQAKFELKLETIVLETESFDKTILLMKDKLDILYEDDFGGKIDVVGDMFKSSQDRTRQLANEMDRLRNITPKNREEAEKLISTMASVQSQMRNSAKETRELERQLDLLKLDDLSKPFKDVNKQLEKQLNQIDNNLQLLQQGVLVDDLSLDMLLPIPDFGDAFLDMRSEAEKEFDAQKDIEKQIQDLKKYSYEEQLKESERYYAEEMDKLENHYQEIVQKIAEANIEMIKLSEYTNPEQLKETEEIQAKIQIVIDKANEIKKKNEEKSDKLISEDKIKHYTELMKLLSEKWHNPEKSAQESHAIGVKNIMTGFLFDLQDGYTKTWGGIVDTVQSSVKSIIESVNKANSAVDNIKTPNTSSGNASSGSSGSNVSNNSPKVGSDEYRKQNPDIPESIGGGKKGYAKGGVTTENEIFVGEFGRELLYTPDGMVHLVGENHAQRIRVPNGTHVVPHEETEKILSRTTDFTSYRGYASGTDFDWEDIFKDVRERDEPHYDGYNSGRSYWDMIARQESKAMERLGGMTLEARKELRDSDDALKQLAKDTRSRDLGWEKIKTLIDKNTGLIKYSSKHGYEQFENDRYIKEGLANATEQDLKNLHYPKEAIDKILQQIKSIKQNDFQDRETSHKDKQKESMIVSISSSFKEEYDNFTETRKNVLKDIEADQKLFADVLKLEELKKSVKDSIAIESEDVNLDELRQSILDKIDNQLMQDAEMQSKLKIDILEQQKENIFKYRDELKVEYDKALDSGNVDLAKEIYQRYNEEANNFNRVNQQINQAIKERYDVQFSLMEKLANRQKQEQKRLQKDLDLLDGFSSQSSSARLQYSERILQTEKNYQSSLIKSKGTLREQLQELKVGSYEWNVINDKVDAFNDKIIDSRNQIANLTKNVASIEFEAQLSNIERQLFDGKTQRQASRELDAKIKNQDRYLKGLEKELEVDKLKMFIRQNDLSLSQEELSLLNSKDKIEKESFNRLSKQLTIRQLEQKLINLSNQKTIEQLKQQEDGSWDFEYVVDQDAIDEANTQLKDSQLDLIKWEEDVQNTKDRNQISSKSEVMDDLRDIVQKTLNGEYETVAEFNKAIMDLNSELYEGLNDGTEGGMVNVTDIFESGLDGMRSSFSSYISQINSILSSLKTELDIEQDKEQSGGSEVKDAEDLKDVHQKSNEDRKKDLNEIKKANQEIYEQESKHIDNTSSKRDALHEKEIRQWEEKQVKYGELIETLKIMEHELVSIQEKALEGQYKSLEDFTKDMRKLGVILANDYQSAWDSIVNKQLDSNKILKNAFNILKSDYGSLSASIIIDSRAMADAVVSASNIVKRAIEMVVNEVKILSIEAKTASEIAVESANIAKSAMESARASVSSARAYASQSQASDSSASSSASPMSINIEASSFASGGYTGDFNSSKEGRLGILHEKERVLDKTQTKSFDELVSKLPSVLKDLKAIQLPHFDVSSLVANMSGKLSHIKDSVVENNYHIGSLELPNITNDSGVEKLVNGLQSKAIQYSKRG